MSPAEIAALAGGRVLLEGPSCRGVEIDTRRLRAGQLFVALPGERTDGHCFLGAAAFTGAAGLLIASGRRAELELPEGPFVVETADPRAALAALASHWRSRLACRVAGITGSFGKSTTKELLAALLGGPERGVCASRGSFNNDLGVPLTLLEAGPETRFLVVELGTNRPGEIGPLAALAAPEVGVITGIGPVHLEGLGDEAGVAAEKGALAEALPARGRLILPAEDPWSRILAERSAAPVDFVSLKPGRTEWSPERVQCGPQGTRLWIRGLEAWLPLPGRHNASNFLLALAAAHALGRPLPEALAGLAAFRPVGGRLALIRLANGALVLDDTYNSNLPAALAALEVLAAWPAQRRRLAVLGAMAESGKSAASLHQKLGQAAAAGRPDRLILVGGALMDWVEAGALSAGYPKEDLQRCADCAEAGTLLRTLVEPGDLLLLKASRSERFERLLEALGGKEGASCSTPCSPP